MERDGVEEHGVRLCWCVDVELISTRDLAASQRGEGREKEKEQ